MSTQMMTRKATAKNTENKLKLALLEFKKYKDDNHMLLKERSDCEDEIQAVNNKKIMNIVFALIWLLILIFVSFWISSFVVGFYIFLLPFTVCIEALTGLTDFLLKLVQFPRYCAEAMMEGRGFG